MSWDSLTLGWIEFGWEKPLLQAPSWNAGRTVQTESHLSQSSKNDGFLPVCFQNCGRYSSHASEMTSVLGAESALAIHSCWPSGLKPQSLMLFGANANGYRCAMFRAGVAVHSRRVWLNSCLMSHSFLSNVVFKWRRILNPLLPQMESHRPSAFVAPRRFTLKEAKVQREFGMFGSVQ